MGSYFATVEIGTPPQPFFALIGEWARLEYFSMSRETCVSIRRQG